MANSAFSFTAYGEVSTYDKINGGYQIIGNGYNGPVYRSEPVLQSRVIGISPAQVFTTGFGTVTANSIIEIIPAGLTIPSYSKKYICDATEATLNTART